MKRILLLLIFFLLPLVFLVHLQSCKKLDLERIAFINTKSYKETTDFLYVAAKQEQIIEKRKPTIHPFKKNDTLLDAQLFLLSSLPNIGGEKARTILKAYQTPLNAFVKVDDWSKTVHGLGPVITKKVKKVLMVEFKE